MYCVGRCVCFSPLPRFCFSTEQVDQRVLMMVGSFVKIEFIYCTVNPSRACSLIYVVYSLNCLTITEVEFQHIFILQKSSLCVSCRYASLCLSPALELWSVSAEWPTLDNHTVCDLYGRLAFTFHMLQDWSGVWRGYRLHSFL